MFGDTVDGKPCLNELQILGLMVVNVFNLKCLFVHCLNLKGDAKFNLALIRFIKGLDGAVFFKMAPEPKDVDFDPEEKIDEFGNLWIPIPFDHPFLQVANPSWKGNVEFLGSLCGGGGLEDSFEISCFSSMREDMIDFESAVQARAEGRVRLFKFLVPLVKPHLGYIDDVWGSTVKDKQVEAAELKKVFWVTYFGPNYVERYGKEFFLNAPAWSVEELDGGVLLRTTETFLEFTKEEPKELIQYLRQKFKGITANRFKIHPAF